MRSIWRFLSRTSVASVLLLLLMCLTLAGALIPQLSQSLIETDASLEGWLEAARQRYGGWIDQLYRLGGLTLFRSPVFLSLLGLTTTATLICTLDRWRRLWRRVFDDAVPRLESDPQEGRVLELPAVPLELLRAHLEDRGYRLRQAIEGDKVYLCGDRYRLSSLATLMTHLAVLLLVLGLVLSMVWGWSTEIAVGPGQTAQIGHSTGLVVRNDGFSLEMHPDGSIAGYLARVVLVEGEQVIVGGTVRVNHPLRHRGVWVLLSGFRDGEDGVELLLRVGKDPGIIPALAGGMLMLVGVMSSLYLPHRRLLARLEPERMVMAIRRTVRHDDPEAEVRDLERELRAC